MQRNDIHPSIICLSIWGAFKRAWGWNGSRSLKCNYLKVFFFFFCCYVFLLLCRHFNYECLTPLFCSTLKKNNNQCFSFWCKLSAGVLCVGPQPAACEDRGPAVIETCYRSTAEHKDRSIQTVRGYTSVCRSDRELSSAIHTQQARETSRLKRCTKNTHVLPLWRTDKNLEEINGRIVSGCCGEKCSSERRLQ